MIITDRAIDCSEAGVSMKWLVFTFRQGVTWRRRTWSIVELVAGQEVSQTVVPSRDAHSLFSTVTNIQRQ